MLITRNADIMTSKEINSPDSVKRIFNHPIYGIPPISIPIIRGSGTVLDQVAS